VSILWKVLFVVLGVSMLALLAVIFLDEWLTPPDHRRRGPR
jgi:hypothetical protein